MITSDYIKSYLEFYPQINILGVGTLFKVRVAAKEKHASLYPPYFQYKLDDIVSQNIDHFVLFVNQKEKTKSYEMVRNEVIGDMKHMDAKLYDGDAVMIPGVGTIKLFNNKITLFQSEEKEKSFGYPIINIK